ncbi:hypothetical protein ABGT15_07550 [Flavobacterium enshiense]|uniref:hypothetical protein n=1 Tax=Flavobacterium enshiense TaxID=1341165 RepID=UPI00345D80D4
MKKAIVIVVFLFVLKPILPVLEYILNYDYIVKELCENKKKPELSCNGKCHLMKELAKASENETPVSSDKKTVHHEFEVLFFQSNNYENLAFSDLGADSKGSSLYSNLYFFENSDPVFHPPTV